MDLVLGDRIRLTAASTKSTMLVLRAMTPISRFCMIASETLKRPVRGTVSMFHLPRLKSMKVSGGFSSEMTKVQMV